MDLYGAYQLIFYGFTICLLNKLLPIHRMKPIFNYHSEQKHEIICKNGKCTKKMNSVTIKNGKGIKEVIVKGPIGKAKRTTKRLSKKEIKAIRKNEFIPGLFKGL